MYGHVRVRLLDAGYRAAAGVARLARVAVTVALHPTRWRPTDLYAASQTAHFHARHHLIDQAADRDIAAGADSELVAARTWPWLGGHYVYQQPDDDR